MLHLLIETYDITDGYFRLDRAIKILRSRSVKPPIEWWRLILGGPLYGVWEISRQTG